MIEQLKQYGLTPGKAALMAVLTVGLGVVWGPQFAGMLGGKSKPVAARAPAPTRSVDREAVAPAAPRSQTVDAATPAPQRERPATDIGIDEAVAYDPFAPPGWSPAARRLAQIDGNQDDDPTELEERFESLRQSGVAMILVSGEGRAAQVGSRTLHVGDELDGFEVVEINDTGVVFRPLTSQETTVALSRRLRSKVVLCVWATLAGGVAHTAAQQPAIPSIEAFLQGAQRVLGGAANPEIESIPAPGQSAPTSTFTLPIVNAEPVDVQNTDGLISLSVRDATLRQVLSAIAETQNLNLVVAAPADLPVTAEFKKRPLREILSALLHSTGHTWTERDGVIVVTSVASGAELDPNVQGRRVSVIELDFAAAADLQPAIEGLLSSIGQSFFVETDPADNRRTKELLIVEDLEPYVARVERYIAEADQPPRQVLIEVNLLQVNLEDDQRCGVNFNALSRVSGANLTLRSAGFADATASPGFFIESTNGDLESVIDALIETTDAKSVASPRILAVNGQESQIQIGEEIGYSTTTTTANGVTSGDVQFLDVGVLLSVTPRITRDGRVLLRVAPEVSTGAINPNTNAPDKQTTNLSTNALLRSGQGMIIGGLIQEQDDTKISRVPWLGSLPYINPLFQRRTVDKRRTELIVALVPHVLPYADPALCARNEHELMRAREPLTYGPLCENPRPYEAALYDPYRDQKRLHCFDRKDPFCQQPTVGSANQGCGDLCPPPQPYAGPRRLPPVIPERASGQVEVAIRPTDRLTR